MRGASDISEARLAQKTRKRKARKHPDRKKILTDLFQIFHDRRHFHHFPNPTVISYFESMKTRPRRHLSVGETEMPYLAKTFHAMTGCRTSKGVRGHRCRSLHRPVAGSAFLNCGIYRCANRHGRRCTWQAPARAHANRFLRNRMDSDGADLRVSNRHRNGPPRPIGLPTGG
jgi:hypothetical protein